VGGELRLKGIGGAIELFDRTPDEPCKVPGLVAGNGMFLTIAPIVGFVGWPVPTSSRDLVKAETPTFLSWLVGPREMLVGLFWKGRF